MSAVEFSRRVGIFRKAASEFVNKRSGVGVEMTQRLAMATGTNDEFWRTMQVQYSLWEAKMVKLPQGIYVQRLDLAHA